MSDDNVKPREERVKEGVTLLKKLQEVGIPKNEPGYLDVKNHIDEWIAGSAGWSGEVYFPRFMRKGELVLPNRKDRTSSLNLLAPPRLRRG